MELDANQEENENTFSMHDSKMDESFQKRKMQI